jgi:hypothetical protein
LGFSMPWTRATPRSTFRPITAGSLPEMQSSMPWASRIMSARILQKSRIMIFQATFRSACSAIFLSNRSPTSKRCARKRGQLPPKVAKRKREGVVYTPDFVTRFIVEETIGKALSERFEALLESHGVTAAKGQDGTVYSWTEKTQLKVWRDYQQELRSLSIVDPACGSGAFLIAAFDYLAAEYKRVAERLAALGDKIDASELDREILAHNLHGVDLNPEPVEITKLSLWLKTAKRGKLLQDLDASIKCGNSLIADKNEHGHAFDWQAERPSAKSMPWFTNFSISHQMKSRYLRARSPGNIDRSAIAASPSFFPGDAGTPSFPATAYYGSEAR